MPVITLPDGSQKQFDHPVTVAEVAASIGPGLAKPRSPARWTASWWISSYLIDADANLSIVTERDAEGLEIIRHSTAHLLAQAVKELFPDAQVTIGPVIEDGFYYDFAYKRPFTPEDLAAIEKRMEELAARTSQSSARVMQRDEAVKFFRDMGEKYKAEIIASIPADRSHLAVPPGRLHRSVPRAARALHRQAQGLQADEGGRRLLARRFQERDAAAHLRHRLGRQESTARPI